MFFSCQIIKIPATGSTQLEHFSIFCQLGYKSCVPCIFIFKKLSGNNLNECFSERHFHFLGSHFATIYHCVVATIRPAEYY